MKVFIDEVYGENGDVKGKLFIESDEYQYLLREYNGKTDATGRELYKSLGYFPTIESALNKLVTMKLKQSTSQDLREVIREVAEIKEYIHSKVEF